MACVSTAMLAAMLSASTPAFAGPPEAPPAADAAAKAEAVAHFDKGIALYDKGDWSPALAEFLVARRLYPLRNALYQAGLCLEKLEKYDEALDQFEATLREYGETMPDSIKESVQRKVAEMRDRLGEIVVSDAEPGATVNVDGRLRGSYPLLTPLRVVAGRRLVQVLKAGFEPFGVHVLVARGKTSRVGAHLVPLAPPVQPVADGHVHIEGDDPSHTLTLYRVEWETHSARYSPGVPARHAGSPDRGDTSYQVTSTDSSLARAICVAPCDQGVPRGWGTQFFLGGEGITPSSRFALDPLAPSLTIKVSPGSLMRSSVGTALLLAGGASVFTGAVTLPSGEVSHNGDAVAIGAGLLIVGSLLVGAGVPAFVAGKTNYSIDGQGPVLRF
jgi:hypothetical protein